MGFWEFVRAEWGVLKDAPLTFVILAALAAGGGFWAGAQWRNPEIAAKDTYIEDLKVTREQLSRFSKTAAEAAPQEKTLTWTVDGQSKAPPDGPIVEALKQGGWSATYAPAYDTTYTPQVDTLRIQPTTPEGTQIVRKAFDDASIPYKVTTVDGKQALTVRDYQKLVVDSGYIKSDDLK